MVDEGPCAPIDQSLIILLRDLRGPPIQAACGRLRVEEPVVEPDADRGLDPVRHGEVRGVFTRALFTTKPAASGLNRRTTKPTKKGYSGSDQPSTRTYATVPCARSQPVNTTATGIILPIRDRKSVV